MKISQNKTVTFQNQRVVTDYDIDGLLSTSSQISSLTLDAFHLR